jgi:ATP-dependent Zn protease
VTSCGWCLSRMLGKVSEHRRQRVDEEIKRIVGEAHDEAAWLLADDRDRLAMRSPRR